MDDRERMFDGDNVDTEESQQGNCGKPEGGWGWIVCCGTFSVNFIVFGIHNSFGVVYEYLVDEKSMGEAETGKIKRQTACAKVLIDKINTCLLVEKVKFAYKPSGPSGRSLSWFLQHEVTKNISTTPGWDALNYNNYCEFASFTNSQLQWKAVNTAVSRP